MRYLILSSEVFASSIRNQQTLARSKTAVRTESEICSQVTMKTRERRQ